MSDNKKLLRQNEYLTGALASGLSAVEWGENYAGAEIGRRLGPKAIQSCRLHRPSPIRSWLGIASSSLKSSTDRSSVEAPADHGSTGD